MLLKILYTIAATTVWFMVIYYIWSYDLGVPKWLKNIIPISEKVLSEKKGQTTKIDQSTTSLIVQESEGNNSPNINAPSAKSINITYGISESLVKELIGLVGKRQEINSLLIDLKAKKMEIAKQEALLQGIINMHKELDKQLAEKPLDNNEPLVKFKHQEFIDNFIAFKAYYYYRNTLNLLNPEKLIEFLNIYLRSILLYPSPETKEYYITASDGRLLRLVIEGHNQKGEKILISLPELFSSLLHDVCNDFIKSANAKHYEMILNLFKRALLTPALDKVHKLNIMDAEAFIRKNKLLHNF